MHLIHSTPTPSPAKLTSRFAMKMALKAHERTKVIYKEDIEFLIKHTGEGMPAFNPDGWYERQHATKL